MGQCFVSFFVRTPIHLVKIYGVRTKDKVIKLGESYVFIHLSKAFLERISAKRLWTGLL